MLVIIMKIKKILPILLCIVCGLAMSELMFRQYDTKVAPVNEEVEPQRLYFAQIGVYSTEDSMRKNLSSIKNYIYEVKDKKYYAYVGIAKDEKNINKIKGYYKENGYNIYVKEKMIQSKGFIEVLQQYEKLLEKTDNKSNIDTIASQIISKYEELVETD